MLIQATAVGCLFLLAAFMILVIRRRPDVVIDDFLTLTMNRSALISMPVPVRRRGGPGRPVLPPYVDAVIVPSMRGHESIQRAVETALNAHSCLVVLASGRTVALDVERLLEHSALPRGRYLVLDPAGFSHADRLRLKTFEHPLAAPARQLSEKKNAGLILARMMGWRSVLFVDDDVQAIGREQLRDAAALLAGADRAGGGRRLVGWAVKEFPDLSSVGHARSYGTGEWRTFVSGGAMVLRCDPAPPFFPPVYNEDMVLGLEILRSGPDTACVAGTLTQDEYDPFGDLARVAGQEFGEVLVEGLSRASGLADAARPEFWGTVLLDRVAMLREVAVRLNELGVHDGVRAIGAAREAHQARWPALLAGFVADWMRDSAVLREFQLGLPSVNRLGAAAAALASGVWRGHPDNE